MENNNGAGVTEAELSHSRCRDGVRYQGIRHRKWGKWGAEIRLCGSKTKIWLGSYDTPQQAAMAYDAALFCLRGPNSRFNFSESRNKISSTFSSSSLKSSAVFSSRMLTADDIKSFSKKYALQQARAMAQAEPPESSSSSAAPPMIMITETPKVHEGNKISVSNNHVEQQQVSVARAGALAIPELWKIQENVARFGCELQLANFMQQQFNHTNNTKKDDDQAETQLGYSVSLEGNWSG